jgi:hypothetical protein
MKHDSSDRLLLLQLTVSADESPELFEALMRIRDPKRRVGRFRDLATRGLIFTLAGFSRAPVVQGAPGLTADSDVSTGIPPGVLDSLLDWTEG